MKKPVLIFLVSIPVIIVLWVAGLLNDLKLIPQLRTTYFIEDTPYNRDVVLLDGHGDQLSLKIDDECGPALQCIDLSMYPGSGIHRLTLNSVSVTAITEGTSAERKYFYVYTSSGELNGVESLVNYPFGLPGSDSTSSYVLLRSVYELNEVKNFKLEIKIDYMYDLESRKLDKVYEVEQKTKLYWRGLEWKEH